MRIETLLTFLGSVKALVAGADAKGSVADDLQTAVVALGPFSEMDLVEFSLLARQAKSYRDEGKIGPALLAELQDVQKKPRAGAKTKAPVDVDSQVAQLREIYQNATEMNRVAIQAELAKIEKANTAPDYKEIAKKFGVTPGSSKPKTTDAIYNKIGERLRDVARQIHQPD